MRRRLVGRPVLLLTVCLATVPAGLASCAGAALDAVEPDPRVVLQSHLSHGLGESPFDSPLVRDSLAAAIVVAAADCPSAGAIAARFGLTDEGGRLLLQRLGDARLLEARGDRLCSAFPIITGKAWNRYATLTAAAAEAAHLEIGPDLTTLLELIRERGWQEWEYHFIWSQLFDSQVAWTELVTRELVPPLAPVVAWVAYPGHGFRSGTNYYPDTELRSHWLMVSWRGGGMNTTGPIARTWELLYRSGIEGQPIGAREQQELAALGVVGDGGTVEFPVIQDGDTLQALLQSTARRYVDHLAAHLPHQEIMEAAGAGRPQAFVMAYHDVSWEILGRLSRSGAIHTPVALMRREPGVEPATLRGVFAAAPVHAPFVDLILAAIASQ